MTQIFGKWLRYLGNGITMWEMAQICGKCVDVDTIQQEHPLSLTRYADKLCSCLAISDGLLPTNLVGHVCSAQISDHVVQLGISPGSHRRRRPGRKRPYRGGRRCSAGHLSWQSSTSQAREETTVPWRSSQARPDYPRHCNRQIAAPDPSASLHFDS